MCSYCYSAQSGSVSNTIASNKRQVRKRRRSTRRNDDDDADLCRHDINSLVPFMDQSFFSQKYKETIKAEKYMLPMFCSVCKSELVDKLPLVDGLSHDSVGIAI